MKPQDGSQLSKPNAGKLVVRSSEMPPSACGAAMKVTEETRIFGATDKAQPSWQDTNMALFGSDLETKIKAAAAEGEVQWVGPPRAGTAKGLQVWRIEKFKVVPCPQARHGEFYTGDSYIVLNTYCPDPRTNPDRLAWDVHFWIGSESTQDEYGTAAYKTVELDDFLGRKAVQFREVQDHESKRFLRSVAQRRRQLSSALPLRSLCATDDRSAADVLPRPSSSRWQLLPERHQVSYRRRGERLHSRREGRPRARAAAPQGAREQHAAHAGRMQA